jgi:hypothetical protein
MSSPSSCLSLSIASATSPWITVVLFQAGDCSVEDATYLGVPFIQSAFGTSLPRCGQEAANVSYVRRPSSRASAFA